MTVHSSFPQRLASDRPICIALLAMGGQGGGVLADWIVALAEAEGWEAQSTSVPGVAQRTGATIYYLEIMAAKPGKMPVFSLMPTPGEVDLVIAAEWMEAGRSILRGLVTPDRTTLIASTHRGLAVVEKEKPGDGVADPTIVTGAIGVAAKRLIASDFDAAATKAGSVVSASLFGALAASAALPFSRAAFEKIIRAGGKGIEPSLRAFAAGFDAASGTPAAPVNAKPDAAFLAAPLTTGHAELDTLLARLGGLPDPVQAMAFAGLRKVVDFGDPAYGAEYLDLLSALVALDQSEGDGSWRFSVMAAKHLANAMAYDDVIGVADKKTRASRFDRVRAEMGVSSDQILDITEFMHPRAEEFIGVLPARWGRGIERRPRLVRWIDRIVNRGRRVKTSSILGFAQLYLVAGLRKGRRRTLRHAVEIAHRDQWLAQARSLVARNYRLAVEVLAARRLVKGYSDTHARGLSKFDKVLSAVPMLTPREDGGEWLARLIKAALADEEGKALDGALQTIATL
jgi:indolepyruvate ferredoxin oxidoreductase, beta subunit